MRKTAIILSILLISTIILVSNIAISKESQFEKILSEKKSQKTDNTQTILKILNINPAQKTEFQISENQKQTNLKEIQDSLKKQNSVAILAWLKKEYKPQEIIQDLENFQVKYIYQSSNGFAGTADAQTISHLSTDSRVSYLVLDKEVKAHLQQSRPLIQANLVENNYNITGANIGVCVLDTGINYSNPYLALNYAGGYDFVNNDADPSDDNGHGTRVSGIIASRHATARGMAPNAKIVAVKVLNQLATGSLSTVAAGMDWCITNKNLYNISVISMSLGTSTLYTPSTNPAFYEPSIINAYNNNIALVASSGNDGSTTGISYPAISPEVISVGATYDANVSSFTAFGCTDATTYADKITCFSNRAQFLTLMAPGAIITSTQMQNNGFGGTWGTSSAAPHVSGTIALMLQRNRQLLPLQIKNILVSTGNNVYDNVTNITYKRVNAWNAVNAVPYLTKTGNLTSNNNLTFSLHSPIDAGAVHVLGLSFGTSPGTPWSDGRTIPMNFDDLLLLSIQSPQSVFLTNSIGTLDSNGNGIATLSIPYLPGIENIELYAGFVAINQTGQLTAISNPVRL